MEGEKEINDYFNNLTDVSNFSSKEFPIIITATDASGNCSKKSQNINFLLKEVKGPVVKLYNSKNELLYENHADSSDSSQNKSYTNDWREDKKLIVKVSSGCPIDKSKSYYIYNASNNSTKVYFSSLNINDLYNISLDIATIEGTKNLQVYATCGTVDSNIFPSPTVEMPSTQIKVDWEAPSCSITVNPSSPDGSNNWYKTKPTVTYQLSDTNGVSGTLDTNGTSSTISSTTQYTNSVSVTKDGTYTYTLNGTDSAGKTCTKSLSIKVDTTAPTCGSSSKTTYYKQHAFSFKEVLYTSVTSRIRCVDLLNDSSVVEGTSSSFTKSNSNGSGTCVSGFFGRTSWPNDNCTLDGGPTTYSVTFTPSGSFNKFRIVLPCSSNTYGNKFGFDTVRFNGSALNFSNGSSSITITLPSNNSSCNSACTATTATIPSSTIIQAKNVTLTASDSVSKISGDSSHTCSGISSSATCSYEFKDAAGNKKTCTG